MDLPAKLLRPLEPENDLRLPTPPTIPLCQPCPNPPLAPSCCSNDRALEELTSEKNDKLVTYQDFLRHSKEVMKPVFEDDRKLFIDAS